ncbi:MAG: secretin N-terminal domain-containing protein [Bdellovibrionales bacterium]
MLRKITLTMFLLIFSCVTLVSCSSSDTETKSENVEQPIEGNSEAAADFDDFDEALAAEDVAGENFLNEEPGGEVDALEDAFADEVAIENNEPSVDGANSANPPAVIVNNISFRANESGGTVLIETDGKAVYASRMNSATNQFILEIQNATLPNNLKRPFITTEFGAEFKSINAYQNPGGRVARVVIQLGSNLAPMVQAEGNNILVVPVSAIQEPAPEQFVEQTGEVEQPALQAQQTEQVEIDEFQDAPGDKWSYDTNAANKARGQILGAKTLAEFLEKNDKFYGRRISIETTEDTDIRDIINLIMQNSGVNMIISEEVQGKIALKLRQVPWDQALVIALKTKNLGYVRQGNVLRIASLDTLEKESEQRKRLIQASKDFEPLVVKVIPVNYASAEQIITQLKPFLTAERGSAQADTRTSSLIVKDTAENVERVTQIIQELDIPPVRS